MGGYLYAIICIFDATILFIEADHYLRRLHLINFYKKALFVLISCLIRKQKKSICQTTSSSGYATYSTTPFLSCVDFRDKII